ncbi:MAG: hypothetical protein OXU45_06555 [Candidatus Melainabacteria bacterium]|nr:hypothetical protein [Candidatus Melainabacteria bacterium]
MAPLVVIPDFTRYQVATAPVAAGKEQGLLKRAGKFFKNYAGIIDSRESITRIILDLTAFDIPTIAAAATRNWSSFCEAVFEGGLGTTTLFVAPHLTKLVAKLASKFFLDPEDQKHYDKLVRFYRHELHDEAGFKQGVSRILAEEPKDLERVAQVYQGVDKPERAQDYQNNAQELKHYFSNLNYQQARLKALLNFKESVIAFESLFEGSLWGGFGLMLRWFRKHILKQDSFSGTKNYVNKEEAAKLGEDKPLSFFQKILGGTAVLMSPLYNKLMMSACRDRTKVQRNKFLQLIDKGLDMTHGLFPKLGLLFSYTTVPKWIGALATVQGRDELIERFLKLCTVLPSWWLGHRIANGGLAAWFDKKLAAKHGVERGILLEPQYVNKWAPDPAKIHHVIERSKDNPALLEDAKDAHAKVLYAGLGLHSLGVFLITMLINKFTKWRVQNKLAKAA